MPRSTIPLRVAWVALATAACTPAPRVPEDGGHAYGLLELPRRVGPVCPADRALGLADARLSEAAARARWSALLPDLRLRSARSDNAWTQGDGDEALLRAGRFGSAQWWEARLGFRLERLLFAEEEVAIERLRVQIARTRGRACLLDPPEAE